MPKNKKRTIGIIDTEANYNALKELAEKNHMKLSQYVRMTLHECSTEMANKPARVAVLTKGIIALQKQRDKIPPDIYQDMMDLFEKLERLG